jgi:tRNA-Thr(GGU) m(6)t(6)A37 methyltransferase TsaA
MVQYELHPIGEVRARGGQFTLRIQEQFWPALQGLEGFSHINVLWWAHELDDPMFRDQTTAEKPYRQGPTTVGIFATRSPARPNPLAVTAVEVVAIDPSAGVVHIAYIDAADGTPVLDLKPYLPAVDRIRRVRTPDWCSDWPAWYEDSATFDWEAVFENAQ